MTRKAERRARIMRWGAIVAAGGGAALVIGVLLPGTMGLIAAGMAMMIALGMGHRVMMAPPGVAMVMS